MKYHESIAVVVGANREHEALRRCLRSIHTLLAQPEDLIFIDNCSIEDIGNWAITHFPGTTVVRLDTNGFYCGGYNVGIKIAIDRGYDFVLIMNSDTEVINPGFLAELLQSAKRYPRAAFIGPLVYFRSRGIVQKTCLQFPRVLRIFTTWLPWRLMPSHFRHQPKEEGEVEFLNGVCMLCRVSALREFGLMDETFGGYVEDADWSWRAQQKGWISVFSPVPSVIHHEETIGYEPYSLKTFLLKRNTVFWYLKVGWRFSAYAYAYASLSLAQARMMAERSEIGRKRHQYFTHKLSKAYSGLLRGDPLGEWFGPPIGGWDNNVIKSTWI
jgi:hypothetical protein